MRVEVNCRSLANAIRGLAMDAVERAGHGHPGAAMGMADIATVLCANHIKYDASAPDWQDRDRIVLPNGHASIMLYSLLYLLGVPGIELRDLKSFRRAGSIIPGHPEVGHTAGTDVTTGPFGQGLGMAVELAMAEVRPREEFGENICNHWTWVFAGDGCLMEGVGQEAASLAAHLGLGKLNVLYDSNKTTIDGDTSLTITEDKNAKFKAMGWYVLEACGHSQSEIDNALTAAGAEAGRPTLVIFRTIIGNGAPTKAGSPIVHGSKLGVDEAIAAKRILGIQYAPFEIATNDLAAWRAIDIKGRSARETWQRCFEKLGPGSVLAYQRRILAVMPSNLPSLIANTKADLICSRPNVATRKASQMELYILTAHLPVIIGGSADLTSSNLTRTAATEPAFSRKQSGRYVNYGVREFAMAAAMNGLAMHGGILPNRSTFLAFSDYMRGVIRLSALMGARVFYIMTHDSIGLGEDGPAHQPIEHLVNFRAIPGLHAFRPADAVETLEVYEIALSIEGPSLFALSRQETPQIRVAVTNTNLTGKGGYVLQEANGPRDITPIATGSEVAIAMEAANRLLSKNIRVAVVSLPCWSLFEAQINSYRADVLGTAPRLAIEAASPFGWTRYVASEDHVIGVTSFGAYASAEELYEDFGLTPNHVVAKGKSLIGGELL